MSNRLTFAELATANRERCVASFHPIDEWSMTDWMTAVAGEVGEAANLIKKARRAEGKAEADVDPTHEVDLDFPYDYMEEGGRATERRYITGRESIGWELADAVIYIDLLCQRIGVDLGAMVAEKFNVVSRRVGSDVVLPE